MVEERAAGFLAQANLTRLLRDVEVVRVALKLPRNCEPEVSMG
jgi:hypothetical protein